MPLYVVIALFQTSKIIEFVIIMTRVTCSIQSIDSVLKKMCPF